MKNVIIILGLLLTINIFAQTPESFKYQAILRDTEGEIISNEPLSIQIAILKDSETGTEVYLEEHNLTSNGNGLVHFNMGEGNVISGNFETIAWGESRYYVRTDLNRNKKGYVTMGTAPLLSVPYALHAKTVDNKDDADANPTNEIQDLQLNGNILTISQSTVQIDLSKYENTNTDQQQLSLIGTELSIDNGNTVDLSAVQDGTSDADADPQNEIQQLSISNDTLYLSKGGQVKLPATSGFSGSYNDLTDVPPHIDSDSTNDFSGNYSDLKGKPDLKPIATSGEYADLNGTPDLSTYDTDASDDFSGNYNDLTNKPILSGDVAGNLEATSVDKIRGFAVSPNTPANGQILKWDASEQKWIPSDDALGAAGTTDGVVSTISITGTENKTLTINRTNNLGSLEATFVDEIQDADSDPTNEIQTLSIEGATLSLTNGGAIELPVSSGFSGSYFDLTNIPNHMDTDSTDDFSGDYNDLQNRPDFSNFDQDESNDFSGQYSDLEGTPVLSTVATSGSYNDLSDKPVLSGDVTGSLENVSVQKIQGQNISAGTPVNGQVLKWNGTAWAPGSDAVTGGSGTDGVVETMSVTTTGNTKSITLGFSSAAPSETLNASFIDEVNDADADATNEIQDISLTGTQLSLTQGSTVDLSALQDGYEANTDAQNLSIDDDSLAISNGNKVDLKPYKDNTDQQSLLITNDVLTIENGMGSVDLSSYINDADADAANEIQDLQLLGDFLSVTGNQEATQIDLSPYKTDTTLTAAEVNAIIANAGYQLSVDDGDIDATNEIQQISILGDTLALTQGGKVTLPSKGWGGAESEALFSVVNTLGDTVFAVYESGVRINVDNAKTKASRGGFAVASRSAAKGGDPIDILNVTSDSVRIYLDENTKASRGGFAVASRSAAKGVTNDIFNVSGDSVRIYLDENVNKASRGGFAVASRSAAKSTVSNIFNVSSDSVRIYLDETSSKASRGGFAVASRSAAKIGYQDVMTVNGDSTRIYIGDANAGFGVSNTESGTNQQLMKLTEENYFIGHSAGINTIPLANQSGTKNIFMGYQSGASNTSGYSNVFLGYGAGKETVLGNSNVFIGESAGMASEYGNNNVFMGFEAGALNGNESNNGNDNVFIGYQSGKQNVGINNVFIGKQSGTLNEGASNVFIGNMCGKENTIGANNVFIGTVSGMSNKLGRNNVFLGNYSGSNNIEGNYNVFLGDQSGYKNIDGDKNVFLGYSAGFSNVVGQSNVFMGNNAGYANDTGSYNVFLGHEAGKYNKDGQSNVFLGSGAGYRNIGSGGTVSNPAVAGDMNVFIGDGAGHENQFGFRNVFLGRTAGYNNIQGGDNVFIGTASGQKLDSSDNNVFVGGYAGFLMEDGDLNTFMGSNCAQRKTGGEKNVIMGASAVGGNSGAVELRIGDYNAIYGAFAAYYLTSGSNNTAMGYMAGHQNQSGNNNVFLGNHAGYYSQGSNKLYIENSDADSTMALIYGEFDNDLLVFNANLGLGAREFGGGSRTFALKAGTNPTTSLVGGVLLYADNSEGTAELKVRDEAGNTTTLSPHNFNLIRKSEPMAWSYYSESNTTGQTINVDMLKVVRTVEKLACEKLVFIRDATGNEINVKANSENKMTSQQEIIEKQQQQINEMKSELEQLKQMVLELQK